MIPETTYATDTSTEANQVQLQLIRNMQAVQHVERAVAMSQQLKIMAIAALKRAHPDRSDGEIRLLFIEQSYGKELADGVRECLARKKNG